MRAKLYVMEKDEYQKWLKDETARFLAGQDAPSGK
jgi:hypothetical protein